jgi:hypothetical protein
MVKAHVCFWYKADIASESRMSAIRAEADIGLADTQGLLLTQLGHYPSGTPAMRKPSATRSRLAR